MQRNFLDIPDTTQKSLDYLLSPQQRLGTGLCTDLLHGF